MLREPAYYIIVNAEGMDGYHMISVYIDGTESDPWGWHPTYASAYAYLTYDGEELVDVRDGTTDEDEE